MGADIVEGAQFVRAGAHDYDRVFENVVGDEVADIGNVLQSGGL